MAPESLSGKVVLALLPVVAAFFAGRLRRPYGHGLERVWALREKAPTAEGRDFLDQQARELMARMSGSVYTTAVTVLQVAGTLVVLGATPVGSILADVALTTSKQVFGPLDFWPALALGVAWTLFLFLYLVAVWSSLRVFTPVWWGTIRSAPRTRTKVWRVVRVVVPVLVVAVAFIVNVQNAPDAAP